MIPRRCARLLLLTALVLASTSRQQFGQETHSKESATGTPTIGVDARLVNIPVVVRDKKGALVTNLTRADFQLEVDGHPQEIRYFDRDQDLPLILGLLVDTSGSVASALDEERSASGSFLDGMLSTPKDQAFVIQFAREVELLQELTSSRPQLQAALKEIDTQSPHSASRNDPADSGDPDDRDRRGGGGGGRGRRSGGGGTALYDAAFLAADEVMGKQRGRKALVILSDGSDSGSKETLAAAIESAQRADTVIYAIYFKGEEPGGDRNRGGGFPGGGGGGGRRGGIGIPGIGFPGGGNGGNGGNGGQGGGNGGAGGGPGGRGGNRVDGKKILARMADETGGRLFEISKKQTVAHIYAEIAEELRSQYRLGYTPGEVAASEGYHRIDLTLPRAKGLTVQTRDGYYTGK